MKKSGRVAKTSDASEPRGASRRPCRAIVGLCLLAAVVIRVLVFFDVRTVPDATSDGLFYQEIAEKIVAGTYWREAGVFAFSPLYVVYLAGVRTVAGADINMVRLSQLALGLCSIGLLYLLARTLLTRRAAVISLCIAALYVPFVFFEVQILGVTLVLTLLLASLCLLVSAVRKGRTALLLPAGWLLGIAALGAPNLLALAAPVSIWLLFFATRTPGLPASVFRGWKPAGRDFTRAVTFAAAVILGILPATLWNHRASGEIIPVSAHGGINFFIGNNPGATGYFNAPPGMQDSLVGINIKDSQRLAAVETGVPLTLNQASSHWFGKGLQFAASEPAAFGRLLLHKAFLFFNRYEIPLDVDFDSYKGYSGALRLPLVGFGMVAVLGIGGLALACRSFARYSLLILTFATLFATVIAFFVSDRYRLPAVPFLILFSAIAIDWGWDRARAGRLPLVVLAAALLIPVAFFVYRPVGFTASPASLHFNLAVSYMNQRKLVEAKEALERCVRAEPSWLEPRFHLASVSRELGDPEGAWTQLAALDRVQNPGVLFLRGQMKADSGLLTSAGKDFATVLAREPSHPAAKEKLAGIDARLAAESPGERQERMIRIREETGQHQRAGRHLRALANLAELRDGGFAGIDPVFLNLGIGFELTQLGRLDDADQAFQAALALSPGNPLIFKNLAILHIQRGDRVKAKEYFREFARLAPNDPQVPELRGKIDRMR